MDGLRHLRRLGPVALILLVAGLLFFSRLRAPLLEPQEARYAAIPAQMLAQHSLLVPIHDGQPYLDKPPLFYWCVAAAYRVAGLRDSSARLVPAIAALCTALLTFAWGRSLLGVRGGVAAALILCLSPMFVYRGRMLTFDTPLMLCTTAALVCGHLALCSRHRHIWWLLSAGACGLGVLVKGPVALVLVVPPLFVATLLEHRRPRFLAWAVYLGIALAIAAPWFVLVPREHPELFGYFFWKHNVERFVAPFDHAEPIWYYILPLLVGLMPWSLLLPGLIRTLCDRSRPWPAGLVLPLLAFGWAFVFFSLAGCKRPTYLLPALPPIALVLAWRLCDICADFRQPTRLAIPHTVIPLATGIGLALTAGLMAFVPLQRAIPLAVIATVLLGISLVYRRRLSFLAAFAAGFLVLLTAVRVLLPAYNEQFALRGQLRRFATTDGAARCLICYPQRWESPAFYLPQAHTITFANGQERELCAFLQQHPDALLLLKSGHAVERIAHALPSSWRLRIEQRCVAVTVARGQISPGDD